MLTNAIRVRQRSRRVSVRVMLQVRHRSQRVTFVNGLRGFAALAVVLYHLVYNLVYNTELADAMVSVLPAAVREVTLRGSLGVNVFFVIRSKSMTAGNMGKQLRSKNRTFSDISGHPPDPPTVAVPPIFEFVRNPGLAGIRGFATAEKWEEMGKSGKRLRNPTQVVKERPLPLGTALRTFAKCAQREPRAALVITYVQ
jgi:hypothetical protein